MRWFVALIVLVGIAPRAGAETLAPGVTYTLYEAPGPNKVHVVAIDRFNTDYRWKIGWAQKQRMYTAREVVPTIASRYHTASAPVLAAVNGAYFGANQDIIGLGQTDGEPLDIPPQIDGGTVHTVMVGPDRMPRVAPTFNGIQGTVTFADGFSLPLAKYNYNESGLGPQVPINAISAFTPHYAATTPAFSAGFPALCAEIVLTNVSYPMRSEKEVAGTISSIITSWPGNNPGSTPILAGGMVLCLYGNVRNQALAHAQVGQQVRVRAVTGSDLYNTSDNALTGMGWIVHNGAAYSSSWPSTHSGSAYNSRHPRTVLAWNDTTWFMIVCEGRTSASVGMTFTEMANFAINTLGATEAVNYDGGGSSTMVVNGVVENTPSDGPLRPVANAILLVKETPAPSLPVSDPFAPAGRLGGWEDKFFYAGVIPFAPLAPDGDGHVIRVGGPIGGVNTLRRGSFGDTDYTVQADVYCSYRPELAGDGYERYALFARDSGTGALGLSTHGAGNCYALVYDSDTGAFRAGKYVNGAFTSFTNPVVVAASGWHRLRIDCAGSNLTFRVDGAPLARVVDSTHARGFVGIGHQEFFTTNSNALGTHADNFVATTSGLPVPQPGDMDGDGDVDQGDFAFFQLCLSGLDVPQTAFECLPARMDADEDVDHMDVSVFVGCMSGANVPASPNCAD